MKKTIARLMYVFVVIVIVALLSPAVAGASTNYNVRSQVAGGQFEVVCKPDEGFRVEWALATQFSGNKIKAYALNQFAQDQNMSDADLFLVKFVDYANVDTTDGSPLGHAPYTDTYWFIVQSNGAVNVPLAEQNALVRGWKFNNMTVAQAAQLVEQFVAQNDLVAQHSAIRQEYRNVVENSKCQYGPGFTKR